MRFQRLRFAITSRMPSQCHFGHSHRVLDARGREALEDGLLAEGPIQPDLERESAPSVSRALAITSSRCCTAFTESLTLPGRFHTPRI